MHLHVYQEVVPPPTDFHAKWFKQCGFTSRAPFLSASVVSFMILSTLSVTSQYSVTGVSDWFSQVLPHLVVLLTDKYVFHLGLTLFLD